MESTIAAPKKRRNSPKTIEPITSIAFRSIIIGALMIGGGGSRSRIQSLPWQEQLFSDLYILRGRSGSYIFPKIDPPRRDAGLDGAQNPAFPGLSVFAGSSAALTRRAAARPAPSSSPRRYASLTPTP